MQIDIIDLQFAIAPFSPNSFQSLIRLTGRISQINLLRHHVACLEEFLVLNYGILKIPKIVQTLLGHFRHLAMLLLFAASTNGSNTNINCEAIASMSVKWES